MVLVTLTTANCLANDTDALTALLLMKEVMPERHLCHMCRSESGVRQMVMSHRQERSLSVRLHAADLGTRVCFEE